MTAAAAAIPAILLAAGQSTRMGTRNKLLIPIGGAPLVTRPADALLEADASLIVVVTGHEAGEIRRALAGRDLHFEHNEGYADGMGSSLACGVRAIPREAPGVLVCLGDLPRVRGEHVRAVIEAFDPGQPESIVVPVHEGRQGHPVLFGAAHFSALASLAGDAGAGSILRERSDRVVLLEIDDDGIVGDIDMPADLG